MDEFSASKNQLWVVRDERGRIYGPFSTERLNLLISKAVFTGSEQIAAYPDGDFIAISRNPEFYDRLLEALAREEKPLTPEERRVELTRQQEADATPAAGAPPVRASQTTDAADQTQRITRSQPSVASSTTSGVTKTSNRAVSEKKTRRESPKPIDKPAEKLTDKPIEMQNLPGPKIELDNFEPTQNQTTQAGDPFSEIIDLQTNAQVSKKKKNKNLFHILLILVVGAGLYLFLDENAGGKKNQNGNQVALMFPKKKREAISEAEGKQKFAKALQDFQADTFSSYLKAEETLVEIIEAGFPNVGAMALLCLTHRELWPFANQDSGDLMALSRMAQMASQKDPVGVSGAACRVVQNLLGGQYDGAASLTDTILNQSPTEAAFYDFKANILASREDHLNALAYADKAYQLWPKWLKLGVQKGDFLVKQNQIGEAAAIYKEIIKANPSHAVAKIKLGELEFYSFKHPKEAVDLVMAGLDANRVPRAIAARGYVLLALNYEGTQKIEQARTAADRAYSLDPTNSSAKEIVRRLGGKESLKAESAADRELVALGEEYVRKGNYFAAQAQFKSAFEMNPKNARAAMLAGISLWELNQSTDAIAWLKKAVTADKTLVLAYVHLADYYSQKYDFRSAGDLMATAQRNAPQSYQVFYGYALVELRRYNYKAAVELAKRALRLYDTDVETHIVLATALKGLGDMKSAYEVIGRAIAMDSNNKKAQALYSEILAGYQGIDAAVEYLKGQITAYPQESEYRIALARVLLKEERLQDAIQALESAIAISEHNKEAFVLLGTAQQKAGETKAALKSYLSAAALDPADAAPLFLAGELYFSVANYNKSMELFEQVSRINQLFPRTHFYIGRTALAMGDADRALKESVLEKRLNPNLADGYLLAGDVYMRKADYTRASTEYQRAAALQPAAMTYVLLARSYRLSQNLAIAETLLAKAVKLESGNPQVYKEQGAIFEARGEDDEARLSFQKYLELMPNAPDRDEIAAKVKSLGGP